jgi:Domain of unknown function (DUF6766)
MRKWLLDHGLTLTMLGCFLIFLIAQTLTGEHSYNQDQVAHGEEAVRLGAYLRTGHFVEATFENWESEYLQMGIYVLATVFLLQRGSSETKDPDKTDEAVDRDPRRDAGNPDAPWPVRRGGLILRIYENSLTLALLSLFVISFAFHLWGGAREYSQEQVEHGEAAVSTFEFLRSSEFWFQSFQNWQSEFLAVASIAWLSVFLRQRGSPESKPVAAPHRETGS